MRNLANILYLFVGSIFPISIGALHTLVHFKDLTTLKVQTTLNESISIMGENQILYHTWGLMSFMMGISFIIIGLLNLGIMRKNGWQNYPPISGILIMLAYLSSVIYAGAIFEAMPQYYGGIFGFILGLTCLTITLFKGTKTSNKSFHHH